MLVFHKFCSIAILQERSKLSVRDGSRTDSGSQFGRVGPETAKTSLTVS